MITKSVTIEEVDKLYLMWNNHINVSTLLRRVLCEEMKAWDVDRDELREFIERAHEQGYTLDEIAENTNRLADLQSLVEDQQSQSPAENTIDE